MIDKFKTLETERNVKNVKYYGEDYLFGYHSTIYVDDCKTIIKSEFINRELTGFPSDITNNGLGRTIHYIEM